MNFKGPLTFHKGGWSSRSPSISPPGGLTRISSTRFIHSATELSRFLLHQADPKKTTEWGRDWRDESDEELAGTRDSIPARDASCSFQTMWLGVGPTTGPLVVDWWAKPGRRRRGGAVFPPLNLINQEYEADVFPKEDSQAVYPVPHLST